MDFKRTEISARKIHYNLTEHDAEVQLKTVLDENGGLPAEDEARIKELVEQAHGKLDEEA